MTPAQFLALPVGTYIRTTTDAVFCNPSSYFKYRAYLSQYYPKDTLFKVTAAPNGGRIRVHIVIDGKEIPNTGGAGGFCYLSSSDASHFAVVQDVFDFTYTADYTDIVY